MLLMQSLMAQTVLCLAGKLLQEPIQTLLFKPWPAPTPMSPLESMASAAVRTAYCSNAALIFVLTRGGTTSKLVAKYRPSMSILEETPARLSLIYRGLIPVLDTGSYGDSMTESTEETIELTLSYAKKNNLCKPGDSVVALHRLESSTVIKILDVC
ncbi:hypothetical protein JHK85_003577 [Glycine max]|nr:hypothetical protein JHK85_003577 [Glycine max]KAG5079341.1 hypothetical protein JHK86_003406 [Glycine max]